MFAAKSRKTTEMEHNINEITKNYFFTVFFNKVLQPVKCFYKLSQNKGKVLLRWSSNSTSFKRDYTKKGC